ncbi:MAG: FAD:protein FMN transferase [Acholeplasmataceae bacterium]|nr:MAG: FAD:protein FMN transferase [Acholeplasmataceae bacterium]
MQKIMLIIITLASILMLSGCRTTEPEDALERYNYAFYDYMDTFISVSLTSADAEEALGHRHAIEAIFSLYHYVSTAYEPLPEDAPYLNNIYAVNQQPGVAFEIDVELYDILVKAQAYHELTDGYFDVSIGKIIDVWKALAQTYKFSHHDPFEIPKEAFDDALDALELIEVVEDPFEVWHDDGRYYVRINSEHVKIDLGAISKGVATQKAYEYLREQDMTYFSISAGSSSITLGQNINRQDEEGVFYVSLANPMRPENPRDEPTTYGMIHVKDTGVTTSGNHEQFALYEGLRYHHIVSPFTKRPMHHYHTVTIIGYDAGLLDAVSTALFSMAPAVFDAWMEAHQETWGIEIIRYDTDGTISTFLMDTVFEERR